MVLLYGLVIDGSSLIQSVFRFKNTGSFNIFLVLITRFAKEGTLLKNLE